MPNGRFKRFGWGARASTCGIGVSLSLSLLLVACGGNASVDKEDQPWWMRGAAKIRPIQWGVASVTEPRTIRIVGATGYCVGDIEPEISSAKINYLGRKIYVTAELAIPPKKLPRSDVCADVELGVYKTITLKQDLRSSVLYDASVKPPRVRWPDSAATAR